MIDRRMFLRRGAAALALTGLPLALFDAVPALARTAKGIVYGANKLDIYTPGTDNAPVIVYVHGGAWRAGNRGQVGSMPAYFNALGYVFVSVSYSLSASVERQAREVGQAVAWVKSNISNFGGNPSRVALMGHSAGCHLASLAALSGLAPGVKALVANDTAAYDVNYLADINNGKLPMLYSAFSDRSKWKNWSPINYAGGGGAMPVLVAWSGGRDRDRISRRFADALASRGHPVTRFDGGRYNHISIRGAMGRQGDPLTAAITRFLAANL